MPKISNLPISTDFGPEDLILLTTKQGTRAKTKQATVAHLANFTKNLFAEADSSGSGLLSATFYDDLANATWSPIPLTLVKRDANGRIKVSNPVDSSDVATKDYVDATINELNDRTLRVHKQTITGSVTSFNIDHNFGTRDVLVQVYDTSSYDTITVDVVRSSINRVQISFSSPPGSSSYRVLVQG